MRGICFKFTGQDLIVTLRDTPTADAIYEKLPFSATARTWGEEVYFSAPVSAPLKPGAGDVVEAGEIAFWTEGNCIAIGCGKTPISEGDEIRLAAKTNIRADAINDVKRLKTVQPGEHIQISAVNN